ncbi:MAG: transcriptional activator RfaH [Alphaproteobacteria bacterium]|nr:transcriptional activator RfaH [Alphaproteobacteria bacterium]
MRDEGEGDARRMRAGRCGDHHPPFGAVRSLPRAGRRHRTRPHPGPGAASGRLAAGGLVRAGTAGRPMKLWYAVHTHPREEAQACAHLKRQGFEPFLPCYLKRRSHARKVDLVPAPLFPRYLFVQLEIENPMWRVIRSTRGVVDLVRAGVDPVPVPDEAIEEIKRRRDAEGFVVLARGLGLKPGSPIRIDIGAFAGMEAIFQAERDEDRVVALLSMLGRQVVVQVPIHAVVPA